MPKDDKVITVTLREAARISGVSERTIIREADNGQLQDVRFGGRRLIVRESLEKALKPPKK